MTPTPAQFAQMDRLARLAVLRELQHHVGLSDEYMKLARMHEYLLNAFDGVTLHRPIK
jgi:hypothetical protein